jgi:hypothetical protein
LLFKKSLLFKKACYSNLEWGFLHGSSHDLANIQESICICFLRWESLVPTA